MTKGQEKPLIDSVAGNNGELMGTKFVAGGYFGGAVEYTAKAMALSLSLTKTIWMRMLTPLPYGLSWMPASWQYIAWKNGPCFPDQGAAKHIDIWVHEKIIQCSCGVLKVVEILCNLLEKQ